MTTATPRLNLLPLIVLAAMLAALLPSSAWAQVGDRRDDDFMLRIGGDITVAEGDVIGTLVVIDGNVAILGEIRNDLVVISGNATVEGSVGQSLTVISGDINLGPTAVVNNVYTVEGNLIQAPGATVTGEVRQRAGWDMPFFALAAFGILFWLAATIAVIVAGLLFAAIGGVQMTRTARTMTERVVNTIVGGVFFWIGLPILAAIIMVTIVGIPLGIAVFVFIMPAVWFLGYLVAGARLGSAILGRFSRQPQGPRPFAAAALGLLILQLLVLIPGLGLIVVLLAGIWGGAALAYTMWTAAGGRSFESEPTTPPPPAD